MTSLKILSFVLAATLATAAQAAPCPRPDALGTARTLAVGLDLLGITAPDRM